MGRIFPRPFLCLFLLFPLYRRRGGEGERVLLLCPVMSLCGQDYGDVLKSPLLFFGQRRSHYGPSGRM